MDRNQYLICTNRVTQSLQGNTKLDLFVYPELWRAVHTTQVFVFPSIDGIFTSNGPSIAYCMTSPFCKSFNEDELSSNVQKHVSSNVSMFTILLSGLKVTQNKLNTQSKVRTVTL